MQRFIYPILFVLLCSAHTCKRDPLCLNLKNPHSAVLVVNSSSRIINFEFYWNYPDTIIGEYNPVFNGTEGLKPNESLWRPFSARGYGCVESFFANDKKEWIYIFDQDTISQLDWEVVRQTNRGLLERRLIDLKYLQEHNFVIEYSE